MKIKSKQIVHGGFSINIMQPIYIVTIGVILILNPFIGLFWATLIVAIPCFIVAIKINKIQDENYLHLSTDIYGRSKLSIHPSDLAWFLRLDNEISVPMIKQYFGVSRYKAKIIRDEIIAHGFAVQKLPENMSTNILESKRFKNLQTILKFKTQN